METIDEEARRLSKSPLNFDSFSDRYKTDSNLYTFSSPSMWALEKHLYYLLVNSTKKTFDPKYKFRPSYMSFDEYGTVILDKVLMYVNNVMCMEQFDLDTIVVPDLSAIVEVVQDKYPQKDIEDLESVGW